jgi:hypothetical protein
MSTRRAAASSILPRWAAPLRISINTESSPLVRFKIVGMTRPARLTASVVRMVRIALNGMKPWPGTFDAYRRLNTFDN